ncbi:hypothetical protein NRB56_01460 [Nocardia sp. RB56]|uniref:DUF6879 domain-containing protein n=2 Tax=Nocardia aurantia TaxID=2585199 RepID=A0A7K0DFY9_9NOCA|nr:hypothetical protein [Nocardia aurantia]
MLRPEDSFEVWRNMFRDLHGSAFHLEVRDEYHVPAEDERLQRFLRGVPTPTPWLPWHDLVRETVERGVAMQRLRVVTVPHSDYQRWLLSVAGRGIEAGEDIRYLPRHLAGEVPPDDWWLMDDRVVFNLVDAAGAPAGLAVSEDPHIVGYCRTVRTRLWGLATPYAEYL